MNDSADELRGELQVRLQELDRLHLEVRHLRADLRVKDEYIAVLQSDSPSTQADIDAARRYLVLRSRVRGAGERHPLLWRAVRALVGATRRTRRTARAPFSSWRRRGPSGR